MIKNFISFNIISILLFFGCSNEKQKDVNTTIVEGYLQSPSSNKVYFYSYADSIDFFIARLTPIDSAVPDKDGHFVFKMQMENPRVFSLQYESKNLVSNLLVSKGDHLTIKFLGKSHIAKIEPIGKEAKFNTFLLNFIDTFYIEPERRNEYYIASNYMDIQQFRKYNERRQKDMLEFYAAYFEGDSLTTLYNNFVVNTIYYELASDRLMYLWKKRMKGDPQKPDSAFLEFSNPSFVENEAAFITPSYIRFINLYLKDTYERMVESGTLPLKAGDSLRPSVEKYKLAQSLFSQPYRNAVLYNLLIDDMNDVSAPEKVIIPERADLETLQSIFRKKYELD